MMIRVQARSWAPPTIFRRSRFSIRNRLVRLATSTRSAARSTTPSRARSLFPAAIRSRSGRRHCEQTPWHPRKFASELSEEFVDVIADMMEKDPARRIQSAAEVAERLEPWASAVTESDRCADRPASLDAPSTSPGTFADTRDHGYRPNLPIRGRLAGSGALSTSGGDSAAIPPLPSDWEPDPIVSQPNSHAMPIAIALAVAIPLSLLVGAIVGFIVRGL